jgi:hypothetical protein
VNDSYRRLSATSPEERILLLSHCLRPSQSCPGKVAKSGLVCPPDCDQPCVVWRLRQAALTLGYKGVCIAAGGAMALRFVRESRPLAIVAVACDKELAEGVEAVEAWAEGAQRVARTPPWMPAIVAVPLLTDGCIDTTVDERQAREAIAAGCRQDGGGSEGIRW